MASTPPSVLLVSLLAATSFCGVAGGACREADGTCHSEENALLQSLSSLSRVRAHVQTSTQSGLDGASGLNEMRVPLQGSGTSGAQWVGLSTRGASALRVRVGPAEPIDTPMVEPEAPDAAWQPLESQYGKGILTGIGAIAVSQDGVLTLMDADGKVLTRTQPISSKEELTFSADGGLVFGRGAGADDAPKLSSYGNVTPVVNNQFGKGSQSYVPHYYTTDGYAALGVAATGFTVPTGAFLSATYDAGPTSITWRNIRAEPLEVYLMPASTLERGTAAYYDLVGRPRVPPLWTFGFMASRWGWKDQAYIEDTLARFRSGGYPADAFITDFEWYTNESDYSFPPEGKSYCNDFDINPELFGEPALDFQRYKDNLHFQMAGIRKPRLCNTDLLEFANSQEDFIFPWGEPGGDPTQGGSGYYGEGRELNYTNPVVRSWYAAHLAPLLRAGVSFWWNDEGETDYFTFYWWCKAQAEVLRQLDGTKRFYSLNRNFAPGMARLGVGVWTGDSSPSWWDLAAQPGYMLNWALAGAPYVGSDIGGFSDNTTADLLTRWYQVGVFMPIMRVHSTLNATPHWPWLWGHEAGTAMKSALELRYRLIPYHYSLAHAMFLNRGLWMRPMSMAFLEEKELANATNQWMDGQLLVAPVLRNDSMKSFRLPQGTWYPFESSVDKSAVDGPKLVTDQAHLDEIPVFAQAGSIVPLAPLVQYTGALPGGPLEVRVYPGKDASFELFEDDGESLGYEVGNLRSIKFFWDEAMHELSWTAAGTQQSKSFSHLVAVYVRKCGRVWNTKVTEIGSSGFLTLGQKR